jgi:hypothetical protein
MKKKNPMLSAYVIIIEISHIFVCLVEVDKGWNGYWSFDNGPFQRKCIIINISF